MTTISTNDVIPALRLFTNMESNKTLDISTYLTPYFASSKRVLNPDGTSGFDTKYANMTRCLDKYPQDEFPSVHAQFVNTDDPEIMANTEWYCIDEDSFDILGDSWSQSSGISALLSVDYCKNMASRPTLYADLSNCVTDTA